MRGFRKRGFIPHMRLIIFIIGVYLVGSIVNSINGNIDKFTNKPAEEIIDPNDYKSDNDLVEVATIVKIADGDTITVDLNGVHEKVRLLEVDTPESVHTDASKNTEYGKKASEYTKSNLNIGQTVYLTKDTSDRDKYDRLLRLVWTKEPTDPFDENELREKCFNARLLLDGYATVAIFNDDSYESIFNKFQNEAMENKAGLWADDSWWNFKQVIPSLQRAA